MAVAAGVLTSNAIKPGTPAGRASATSHTCPVGISRDGEGLTAAALTGQPVTNRSGGDSIRISISANGTSETTWGSGPLHCTHQSHTVTLIIRGHDVPAIRAAESSHELPVTQNERNAGCASKLIYGRHGCPGQLSQDQVPSPAAAREPVTGNG
jgi:hypothetical protein